MPFGTFNFCPYNVNKFSSLFCWPFRPIPHIILGNVNTQLRDRFVIWHFIKFNIIFECLNRMNFHVFNVRLFGEVAGAQFPARQLPRRSAAIQSISMVSIIRVFNNNGRKLHFGTGTPTEGMSVCVCAHYGKVNWVCEVARLQALGSLLYNANMVSYYPFKKARGGSFTADLS